MKKTKRVLSLLMSGIMVMALTACGNEEASSGSGVRTIKVCAAHGFYPITYADDDGNAAGYDVEVFKAIDELLPQYKFTYELADKETMNVGVQTGTYQIGINMLFKTDTRMKTYLMPEQNMGNATIVIIQNANRSDFIASLQDVYDRKLTIYPTTPAGGIPNVIDRWNAGHPDAQVTIKLDTGVSTADSLAAVQAGEYDAIINIQQVYNLFDSEAVAGLTTSEPIDVIHTYPIINKNEEQLAKDVEEALVTLYENGTLSKISNNIFGYDVFELQ